MGVLPLTTRTATKLGAPASLCAATSALQRRAADSAARLLYTLAKRPAGRAGRLWSRLRPADRGRRNARTESSIAQQAARGDRGLGEARKYAVDHRFRDQLADGVVPEGEQDQLRALAEHRGQGADRKPGCSMFSELKSQKR